MFDSGHTPVDKLTLNVCLSGIYIFKKYYPLNKISELTDIPEGVIV